MSTGKTKVEASSEMKAGEVRGGDFVMVKRSSIPVDKGFRRGRYGAFVKAKEA